MLHLKHSRPSRGTLFRDRLHIYLLQQQLDHEGTVFEINTAGVNLRPRKLHPVLGMERAERNQFTTGQETYFFSHVR